MAQAQQVKDSSTINDLKSFLKLKVSLNCGPEWEIKISKTSSINFFAGPELGMAADGFSFSSLNSKWQVVPDAYVEYRNYYNLRRRNNQQKKNLQQFCKFFIRQGGNLPSGKKSKLF